MLKSKFPCRRIYMGKPCSMHVNEGQSHLDGDSAQLPCKLCLHGFYYERHVNSFGIPSCVSLVNNFLFFIIVYSCASCALFYFHRHLSVRNTIFTRKLQQDFSVATLTLISYLHHKGFMVVLKHALCFPLCFPFPCYPGLVFNWY